MAYEPKGKTFDEFEEGDEFFTQSRTITEADVVNFAGLTGDFNPLHTDEEFMKKSPFKTRIAHGLLSWAIGTGLANQLGIFEGTTIALLSMTSTYKAPVLFGDTIRLRLTVKEMKETSKPGRGIITFSADVLNQDDTVVIDGEYVVMLRSKE